MLILLAEDDQKIAKMLIHLLVADGYTVDHAKNGVEAMEYVSLTTYDMIILDWMMPKMTGIEVLQALRNQNYQGGILMLTAKDNISDKVTGLKGGADDYLTKPFDYQELLARLIALSRRSTRLLEADITQKGPFEINRTHKDVLLNHRSLSLSNREYQLFMLLFENNNQIIPRETIIDLIWGIDGEVNSNTLDAFIRLLRKKIEPHGSPKVLFSVRGIGYRMEV